MTEPDIRAFLAGERTRFVNYVRGLVQGSTIDAEDIVQDVLLRLLERGTEAPPLDQLTAYTFTALRNRIIDITRRTNMTSLDTELTETPGFLEALISDDPDTLTMLQTEQGHEALFAALLTLSDPERDIIIAHEFEGRSFKDLAQAWSTPINTLLSHKSRAVKKLRIQLIDQGDS